MVLGQSLWEAVGHFQVSMLHLWQGGFGLIETMPSSVIGCNYSDTVIGVQFKSSLLLRSKVEVSVKVIPS